MDFRDQFIKEALDKAVRPYRPERTVRSRLARMAMIAVVTIAAVAGLAWMFHYAMKELAPPPAAPRPITVELLPAPTKR
jgi:hypothetical protein